MLQIFSDLIINVEKFDSTFFSHIYKFLTISDVRRRFTPRPDLLVLLKRWCSALTNTLTAYTSPPTFPRNSTPHPFTTQSKVGRTSTQLKVDKKSTAIKLQSTKITLWSTTIKTNKFTLTRVSTSPTTLKMKTIKNAFLFYLKKEIVNFQENFISDFV